MKKRTRLYSILSTTLLSVICMLVGIKTSFAALIGMSYNSATSQNELYSIDPATGTTSLLNSFAFDTGAWIGELAITNSRIFTQSSGGTLYEFYLNSGAILSTHSLGTQMQTIAAGTAVNNSAVTVPTLSTWSMVFLIILLAVLGFNSRVFQNRG